MTKLDESEYWQFPVAVFFADAEPKALNLNHGDIVNRSDNPPAGWTDVAVECVNRINPPERYRESLIQAIVTGLHDEARLAGGWKNYAMKVKPSSTDSTPVTEDPRETENRKLKEKIAALERAAESLKNPQQHVSEEETAKLKAAAAEAAKNPPSPAKSEASGPAKKSTASPEKQ